MERVVLEEELYSKCRARILCGNKEQREWFVRAAQACEMWEGVKKGQGPQAEERMVAKYWKEVEQGKETSFCLMSEKQRISALYPLTAFSEHRHTQVSREGIEDSPRMSRRYYGRNSILYKMLMLQ